MLVGAGCAKYTGDQKPSPSASNPTPTGTSALSLMVTALGNKQVDVKFTVPEADKKNAEGYRILMGRDANPDMKTASDWYTLGKDHMGKMWGNRPEGKRHFRVCIMKMNTCAAYSNNVEVEIK